MKRERLGSRLGFILLSAGCAIGIGNVWRFPYVTGQYGGGVFVLVYLFFLIVMGVPVMTMEFSMGRASRKSPVHIYDKLAPSKSKWFLHGYLAMAGNYILMFFYTVVSGWMLKYFVDMASGKFEGANSKTVANLFNDMLADPVSQVVFMAVIVVLGFFICSIGLQNGLEKITKVMMIALLIIMVILAINSVFMKGASKGLAFYLIPDFKRASEQGFMKLVVAAMNQSFFTLSLGIGAMAIFGSYIGNEKALLGESINVALLDTFVAISAGLIIFPACYSYNVEVNSGPGLIFITLPNIFNDIAFGRVWGSLFFVFMTFAAFSTVLAVFENILACTMDLFGWSRKKACLINCIIVILLSVPCALGFNLWSGLHPLGGTSSILDFEDFLVSNILLPGGSVVFVLFCVSRYGWGWENFVKEANKGDGFKVKEWMRAYMTYVLPILVIAILILGLVKF
jgi:hypothetical protein